MNNHSLMIPFTAALALTSAGCAKTKDGAGWVHPGATIRVMVVYTADAFEQELEIDGEEASTYAWVTHLIGVTNETLRASGISHRVELAGAYALSATQKELLAIDGGEHRHSRLSDALRRHREVRDERERIHADLVIGLVKKPSNDAQGQANYTTGSDRSDWRDAYGTVNVTKVNTFVHEIGHLLGADHDRGSREVCDPTVPYGCGYVDTCADFRTIMSYNDACHSCSVLRVFSTPFGTYEGAPMGAMDSAYNACVIEKLGHYVASFSAFDGGSDYWRQEVPDVCDLMVGPDVTPDTGG